MTDGGLLVICNPGARAADEGAVREALERIGEVRCTERPGHATELARRGRDEGFGCIVAAGGDGTLHEVANGLLPDPAGVLLGLLPLGTGNDFARSLGVPAELDEAVEILRRRRTREVDAIEFRNGDERAFFLNMAVGGAVQEVNERLTGDVRAFWGPLAYLRATAESLPELEPFRVELEIDGEGHELAAHTVIVANGRRVAGGIPAAPRAAIDDGLAEVIVIEAIEGMDILALGARVLVGRHLDEEDERILYRRGSRVEVSAEPPMGFNLDGEPTRCAASSFEVRRRALRVVAGPEPD